ncbi:small basic protein [Bremerella sp. JC770]|uniref:small basic protein n=1 Tax=Bremerella sp. JC770 TaxID=3232137 RepID=UPI003459D9C8
MTIDKSLKVKRGGISTRSVLKRTERIALMKQRGTFDEETSPIGLPKTKVVKISMKKKKKVKEEDPKK